MAVTADVLRDLHHLHQRLAELNERLDRGPKQVKIKQATVASLEAEVEAAKLRDKEARMAGDKKQLALDSAEAKIADRRTQLNTCSTNKEYQALTEQIAADEMAKSVMEDEILESFEKAEGIRAQIGVAEENLDKGRQELDKTKQKVDQETAGLLEQVAAIKQELAEAEKSLPADFRPEYDRMVGHRGHEAMAAVEDRVCTGCYKMVTPNMEAELAMQRVVVCLGCARMLYGETAAAK